jgi:hypothetical protein
MLRLVAFLLWLALESLVRLTLKASANAGAFAFGFIAAPFIRLRERRRAKRAAKALRIPKEGQVNEQVQSVIRTVVKSAGGALVGAGIVTNGELEVLAGAVAVLIGLGWSWYSKRKAA